MFLLNTEKELNNNPLLRPNHLRFINSFNFLSHPAKSVTVLTRSRVHTEARPGSLRTKVLLPLTQAGALSTKASVSLSTKRELDVKCLGREV